MGGMTTNIERGICRRCRKPELDESELRWLAVASHRISGGHVGFDGKSGGVVGGSVEFPVPIQCGLGSTIPYDIVELHGV